MPGKAAEIPVKYRKEPWARLGVDVDHDFEALYVVHADKKSQVTKLRQLLTGADELLLATDEDREGEAIAWHLLEELKPRVPARRMVFHEITPEAIAEAVAHPRDLDRGLVDAYQTRRVLDRLYGYEVSPVLWKKVMPPLSAAAARAVAAAVGGAGAVGREPARRGQGAGADRVPARGVLGPGGDLHPRQGRGEGRFLIPRQAGGGGRPPGGAGPRFLARRGTPQPRPALPR